MTIRNLRPPEDVPALLESVATAGARDGSGPWQHIKKDETVIEVEIVSHKVVFRGRRGRVVVAIDVTERQRLQRQLDQVQRLESLGQLAGGVAHELDDLLGVIPTTPRSSARSWTTRPVRGLGAGRRYGEMRADRAGGARRTATARVRPA